MRYLHTLLLLLITMLLLATPALAKTVNLSWDASPSDGVTGYKVYYNCQSSDLPFAGTEAAQPSPIDVGDTLSATVEGIADNLGCYFAVTAYDAAGYESDNSNMVYSPGFAPPDPPVGLGGSTTVNNVDIDF